MFARMGGSWPVEELLADYNAWADIMFSEAEYEILSSLRTILT